jgi:hypothetical protein
MKAEDFDRATLQELLARANKCFDAAPSPLDEPDRYLDDAAKLRLLLEAQFYLSAVGRKRDEEVARRDRKLEIWVIILIGVEIVLSVAGIGLALYEGNQQASVLSNIEGSSKDSADAMSHAKTSLEGLTDSQSKSLDHLKKMDETLRSSQELTGAMVSATRRQLKILAQEQANRLAQLAKKPKLVLHYGDNGPALGVGVGGFDITPRKETDTSVTMDFSLVNEGDAIATRPSLRIVAPRAVTLVSTPLVIQGPVEASPDSDYHAYLANLINLRPQARVPPASLACATTLPGNGGMRGRKFCMHPLFLAADASDGGRCCSGLAASRFGFGREVPSRVCRRMLRAFWPPLP